LTGSAALLALLQSPSAIQLTTITRKDAPSPIQAFTNGSTTYTNRALSNLSDAIGSSEGVGPSGGVYVSCLGTTRGAAGGFEKQKEIDLYLNRDLVTKAKADGAKTVSHPVDRSAKWDMVLVHPRGQGMGPRVDVHELGRTTMTDLLTKQAILVSSGGANANSMMGYPQIKGELEEDFKKLDFEHCIILRPGLLMGARYV
jgi:hypothetical protein